MKLYSETYLEKIFEKHHLLQGKHGSIHKNAGGLFWLYTSRNGITGAGGKPSTWFPPGGLVEHSNVPNNIINISKYPRKVPE